MKKVFLLLVAVASCGAEDEAEEAGEAEEDTLPTRQEKVFSVFNVVSFPNSACGASSGYNGTCYTSSECTSKGGTASGTCASSFGVCCVFSISCGGTSSANNTYAIVSSYSVSSDADPCTYTFCKVNSDVCKLRIDYDTMVLTAPFSTTSSSVATDSTQTGDCQTDTLTVSSPGFSNPPTICGYNTGQHMWVPAADSCNQINIDIDTGSTSTTRKWQIKVTQYECDNLMMPVQDCLQYHTAQSGTLASFNYDTSSSTVATSQTHLSSQYYDICIRRARSYCSVCYSPAIAGTGTTAATSYGIGASSAGPAQTATIGSECTGVSTIPPSAPAMVGLGDYLDIAILQPGTGTSTTVSPLISRICGTIWNAAPAGTATAHATACTFAAPFKIGVHFDADEAINTAANALAAATNLDHVENGAITSGSGQGYQGFYFNYWQNSC